MQAPAADSPAKHQDQTAEAYKIWFPACTVLMAEVISTWNASLQDITELLG
jgi:hypothetical protein